MPPFQQAVKIAIFFTKLLFTMFSFILKRILMVIPTFIAITLITFALVHLIPGDPIEIRMGERGLDPAVHAQMMAQLGSSISTTLKAYYKAI